MTYALAAIALGSYLHGMTRIAKDMKVDGDHTKKKLNSETLSTVSAADDSEEENDDTKSRFRREKRGGDSIKENVYQRIRSAIVSREIEPSVRSIAKVAKSMKYGYQAIDRMVGEGVIAQSANGRYKVIAV